MSENKGGKPHGTFGGFFKNVGNAVNNATDRVGDAVNEISGKAADLVNKGKEIEAEQIAGLFFEEPVESFQTISTGTDDSDFRETLILRMASGSRYVLKLADNDFSFPEKIEMWKRTAAEYRKLGCWCPAILPDRDGSFPTVRYKGRHCVAYAEEFAPYIPSQDRLKTLAADGETADSTWIRDAWRITARVAAKHFDYTEYPSAWCLFKTFCPSDRMDEVLENALAWKECAESLPDEFRDQVQRIWQLWRENRKKLEPVYGSLPASVFQADLNPTNILLDTEGKFVGLFDFNLCGREIFLNYLFREVYHENFETEISMLFRTLRTVSEDYSFSETEKQTALMLYRCLKPLWYNKVEKLKRIREDRKALRSFLNETERYLTEDIDFAAYMA